MTCQLFLIIAWLPFFGSFGFLSHCPRNLDGSRATDSFSAKPPGPPWLASPTSSSSTGLSSELTEINACTSTTFFSLSLAFFASRFQLTLLGTRKDRQKICLTLKRMTLNITVSFNEKKNNFYLFLSHFARIFGTFSPGFIRSSSLWMSLTFAGKSRGLWRARKKFFPSFHQDWRI